MIKTEFMERALENARKAAALGEVPVGAVIVKENKIIVAENPTLFVHMK